MRPVGILGDPANRTMNFGEKVDKLPTYCDPPNPCPLGYNPDSLATPCDKNVLDTKEFNQKWIWDKMLSGECKCDTEHMKHCPWQPKNNVKSDKDNTSEELEKVRQKSIHAIHLKVSYCDMFHLNFICIFLRE
ncbi:unnamed protein product [Protopolystoma xenopodis]|uniref:Neuroendocrine protein 7B2 n=1 Tax=Protopolystoma xenopodis TaxID=117903 RepID=A0A3S5AM13_9PLAT|nr:unnamed protein product [Protopolystoma xenopodis]